MADVPPSRSLEKTRARVDSLRVHPRNPRTISPARMEQLQRTLEAEPEMLEARPLIALPDGTVVAGNQRLLAARALGWEEVPVVYADLSEDEVTRWMLLDNRPFGEDDREQAATLLTELEARGGDLSLTGYDPADLDGLLRDLRRSTADPDDAPPAPAVAKSRLGEVYELGPHRLMCGDATAEEQVRPLFADEMFKVELMWTDPPYGVGYVGKTADALTIANDQAVGLRDLLVAAFTLADRVLAESARFYVAAPAGPRHQDFLDAIREVGWTLHETLIWVKNSLVLGHADYHYRHEPILYGWKPGDGRPGRGKHAGTRWYGGHDQDTVFEIDRPSRSSEHPTMKPVELISRHLVNSVRVGDAVYDPFAGSGSTLIACESLGMVCYAMELSSAYCDVIRQRYADYTSQPQYAP